MNQPRAILKQKGNYYLVRGVSQHAMIKRYAFLVVFQGPEMRAPMNLKGFGKTELDLAQRYFESKANLGTEQRSYEKRVREDLERKKAGMVRIDANDEQESAKLVASGYHLVLSENGAEWYARICTRETHEMIAASLDPSKFRVLSSKVCGNCGAVIRLVNSRKFAGVSVLTFDLGMSRKAA